MRKSLLLISLLAIILISGSASPMMRLTIINKSGTSLALSVIAMDRSKIFYLPVPYGSRQRPSETTFTFVKDYYRLRVYYIEEAPAYTGRECSNSRGARMIALRNIRVVVTECDRRPPTAGEPSMVKLGRDPCIE